MVATTVAPIEVLPLQTQSDNDTSLHHEQQWLTVHDAASLRGDASSLLWNDGGDVLAFIQNRGNERKVVVQRMDGTDVASFALPLEGSLG